MENKSEDRITPIRDILRVVHDLKEATAVSHTLSRTFVTIGDPLTVVDSVNLPNPRPLLPLLLEAGLGREVAGAISNTHQLRAEELRRRIQGSIITACREIAELPVVALASPLDVLTKKLVFTFTGLYWRRLERWKEEIIQRINQVPKTSTAAAPRNSRNFNQEYVPLLEYFFEENPFPTHADKVFLAKKSNMQYRQIHVWFQNRRNRIKKEGKTLRKKPTYEGAARVFTRVRGYIVNSDSQVPKRSKEGSSEGKPETETAQSNTSKDVLASSSPPHTFPSSYPPTCRYDPFPCKTGPVCFSRPEWRRVPHGKPPLVLSTTIHDLVEKFSHLNVRDETGSRGYPKLQSHAATVAITVIPSRAPHPSLIARDHSQPTNIVLHRSIYAPVSHSRVFQSPSPTSRPIALVPLSAPLNKDELGKRETIPLPQHFADQIRNTHRDTTPLESSSTSSSPRLFPRGSESHTCSFSSVSSSSLLSSVQGLPHLFGSPCRSPFSSPIHSRNLGDTVATPLASVS